MTKSFDPTSWPLVAKGRRPIRGVDPAVERLSAMVTALLAELTVTRERLDTVERLLERQTVLNRADIETFEALPADQAERDAIRRRQLSKVFRPLRDDAARAAAEGEKK